MIMNLLAWLIVGLIAGWLASMVMKTNAQQGMVGDIIVGIIGAFIGGAVLSFFNIGNATPGADGSAFNVVSIVTAFIGAVILLAILRAVRRA
jgi:uncharacterized membrane protein YeaQ/YmgE (transglycosylase-associated protein family)